MENNNDEIGGPFVLTGPWAYEKQDPDFWPGRVAVVMDVLRATSTMVTALAEGYAWILTCRDLEEARRQALCFPGSLLAGEREGLPPAGFDRGNSPREFLEAAGRGGGIVLSTSNGTRAMDVARSADLLVVASFLNLGATVDFLRNQKLPVVLICSGTGEDFALEDALLAGAILDAWCPEHPMASLYRAYADRLKDACRQSRNGKRLVGLGLEEDIDWCLRVDVYKRVVAWNGAAGRLELLPV